VREFSASSARSSCRVLSPSFGGTADFVASLTSHRRGDRRGMCIHVLLAILRTIEVTI